MAKIGNIDLGEFPLLLAPMEDVSDPPFRAVCKAAGADLVYTEFISSEGLIRDALKSKKKLDIFDNERPIGIQLFGSDPKSMYEAAKLADAVAPDLIDINYGCPVKNVACKGAGAALLRDIPKMVEMTKAVIRATALPVTVKTRLGWDDNTKNIVEVAERLQDIGVAALTIHGRTRAQLYKGPADWTLIGEVKSNPRLNMPIFGNGDVDSPEKALAMRQQYGVDGVMIGRASIGYPWIFSEIKTYLSTGLHAPQPNIVERVRVCKNHLDFSIQWKGSFTGIVEMRRHYTNYFKGVPHFKDYRQKLVTSSDYNEISDLLATIEKTYQQVVAA